MNFLESLTDVSNKLGPIIKVGSGLLQAAGGGQQYSAYSSVSRFNSEIYDNQAELITKVSAQNKRILEQKKKSALSTMRSQYAFRGVQLTGSPLLVMAESASALEQDVQNAEFNSLVDASRARSQAAYYGVEADAYNRSGSINKSGSLINTISEFAGTYVPKTKEKKADEV